MSPTAQIAKLVNILQALPTLRESRVANTGRHIIRNV